MNAMTCKARYKRHVSDRLLRRVWATVTRDPQIRVRTLAEQLGYRSWSDVSVALRVLRDAGYIDFESGMSGCGARTVIIPFVVTKKERR